MNSTFVRFVCRVLVVCVAMLPFQAGAGLVATGETVAGSPASSAPSLSGTRAALADQLEAYGIAAAAARERIASLSDAEAAQLAGQLDRLPAGANGAGIGFLLLIIFLFWRFTVGQEGQAAQKEPAKAAPAKPAPAKP